LRDVQEISRRTRALSLLCLVSFVVLLLLSVPLMAVVGGGRSLDQNGLGTKFWSFFAVLMTFGASFLAAVLSWMLDVRRRPTTTSTKCNRCGYDRRGLGPNSTCPECGFRVRF